MIKVENRDFQSIGLHLCGVCKLIIYQWICAIKPRRSEGKEENSE